MVIRKLRRSVMSTTVSQSISAARRISQKAKNFARNRKISLTVNLPYANWKEIRGLSIGGRAERVTGPQEMGEVSQLMFEKFPQIAGYAPAEPEEIVLFRVTPEIISVLDYRKGFGNTDLVNVDG